MTILSCYQFTVTDSLGNIIPSASISVTRESDAGVQSLFSDRAGATPIGNPFAANNITGFAQFFCAAGFYKIIATSGSFSQTFRYVAIGLAAGIDVPLTTVDKSIPRYSGVLGNLQTSLLLISDDGILNLGTLSGGINAPTARLIFGSYFDQLTPVSICHIDLYGGVYGFGINSGSGLGAIAYITASGAVHDFYTGADLVATHYAARILAYNTNATSTSTGSVQIQGGLATTLDGWIGGNLTVIGSNGILATGVIGSNGSAGGLSIYGRADNAIGYLIYADGNGATTSLLWFNFSTTHTTLELTKHGSLVVGEILGGTTRQVAQNATDGFLYITTCATGSPSGVPTAKTGAVAMVYDPTNDKLWIYNGAWKQPKVSAVAAIWA